MRGGVPAFFLLREPHTVHTAAYEGVSNPALALPPVGIGSRVQIPLVRPRKPVVPPFPQYWNGGFSAIQGQPGAMYYRPHAPADPWRGIPGPYENGPLPVLRCQKGSMGAQDGSWRGRTPRSPSFASPAPRGNSVNPRVVALTSRIPPMRPGGGLGPIIIPPFLRVAQCIRRPGLSAHPRRNA